MHHITSGFLLDFPASIPPFPLILPQQMHGNRVEKIVQKDETNAPQADALITQEKNLALGIRVADCLALQIFDPKTSTIANIHAGWRGLANGIIKNTVENFTSAHENLLVWISPSIGPCCFTMTDPKKELPESLHPFILENGRIDLWSIAEHQLKNSGVLSHHIENQKECTVCDPSHYKSHRRGDKERMLSYIALV